MPLDSNLLYGEIAGSWLVHLAIPIGVSVLISVLPYMPLGRRALYLLIGSAILSVLVQAAFLTALQASACSGVKDYGSIGVAALFGGAITAGMMALPIYVEPLRLVVSQLFGAHKSLLTPKLAQVNNILTAAGRDVAEASVGSPDAPVQTGGAALTPIEYEAQAFKEMMIGASYWAAFAGAYGVGLGSMMTTKCPAAS
jgi:hypothetical protein